VWGRYGGQGGGWEGLSNYFTVSKSAKPLKASMLHVQVLAVWGLIHSNFIHSFNFQVALLCLELRVRSLAPHEVTKFL
jgi:hypothetical protein